MSLKEIKQSFGEKVYRDFVLHIIILNPLNLILPIIIIIFVIPCVIQHCVFDMHLLDNFPYCLVPTAIYIIVSLADMENTGLKITIFMLEISLLFLFLSKKRKNKLIEQFFEHRIERNTEQLERLSPSMHTIKHLNVTKRLQSSSPSIINRYFRRYESNYHSFVPELDREVVGDILTQYINHLREIVVSNKEKNQLRIDELSLAIKQDKRLKNIFSSLATWKISKI